MPEIDKDSNIIQEEEQVKNNKKKKKRASKKNDSHEKNSILFYVLTILTALLLVALIIGGTFFFAIKKNVNGIADNMRDSIEKIPVLNLALPPKPDIEDEKNMTEEQVRIKYSQIRTEKADLEKQLSALNSQLEEQKKQLTAKDTNSSLMEQQKNTLEQDKLKLNSDYESLKKDFDEMSAAIAKGDTTEFKKFFEKLDPKIAADLYAEILKDEKISDDAKKYISIYETMDTAAVASVMEQLGTGKMTLIVEIMKNLKKDTSGAILSEMTPEFAAKVSEQLAKAYNVGTAKEVK